MAAAAAGYDLELLFRGFSQTPLLLHAAMMAIVIVSVAVAVYLNRAAAFGKFKIAFYSLLLIGVTTASAVWFPPPVDDPKASARVLESAIAQAQAGHRPEALDALRRLVALEPANAPAWANLCGIELETGKLADAEATCREAVALAPSNWLAQYNAACASALGHQPERALAALGRALELVEADPRAGLSRLALAGRARKDTMLQSLRGQPRFDTLVRGQ
jgi:tetratricopeptide (TPR) repeat protein